MLKPKDRAEMDEEIVTVVDVYLSGDKHHDTHYFQKAFMDHLKKYKDKLGVDGVHYVFTDGAPSHFKNRFTISFLIHVYQNEGITVMWGFNAPSHGKGAWDGIGSWIYCDRVSNYSSIN